MKGVATLGERREGHCDKKRQSWCERARKTKRLPSPGEQGTMLCVQQQEDNHLARSQADIHYQERAEERNQRNQIHFKTGYSISDI